MSDAPPNAWFARVFEGAWLAWDTADTADASQEAEALVDLLDLDPGAAILDLPCGWGRLSVPLAARGYAVTGADLSQPLLDEAVRRAAAADAPARFLRADMRALPWDAAFDAVLNVYSSFGFFDTAAEERAAVSGMLRALKPGGRLVIEGLCRDFLARRFREREVQRRRGWEVICTQQFDHATSRLEMEWEFRRRPRGGEPVTVETHRLSVRVYTPGELTELVEGAGGEVVGLCGDYDGTPYAFGADRLLLLAQRPLGRG